LIQLREFAVSTAGNIPRFPDSFIQQLGTSEAGVSIINNFLGVSGPTGGRNPHDTIDVEGNPHDTGSGNFHLEGNPHDTGGLHLHETEIIHGLLA
jgi:hypothetical protein